MAKQSMKLSESTISRLFFSALFSALLLSGCAGSVIIPYPTHLSKTRTDLLQGKTENAVTDIQGQQGSQSVELNQAEAGRVQQIAKHYPESILAYQQVLASLEAEKLAAKIRVSDAGNLAKATAINDNVIPYTLKGYEAVLANTYQAMNYLAQGDLQNGLVFIRKANGEQRFQAEQHEKELAKAQAIADEHKWSLDTASLKERMPSLNKAALIRSSVENGFLYYLSSVCYQASGDLNNAIVSIKKAWEVMPNNNFVQQQLLALLLLRDGQNGIPLQTYARQFSLKAPEFPKNAGLLVVIDEEGLIPPLKTIQIPLPLGQSFQMFSLPVPSDEHTWKKPLEFTIQPGPTLRTLLITDVRQLASKALIENYPIILIRQTVRTLAKTLAAAEGRKHSEGLGLLIDAFSLITSQPDLRSWLTLPDKVRIAQSYLSAGHYQVLLNQSKTVIPVELKANGVSLLWVIRMGKTTSVSVIPLS